MTRIFRLAALGEHKIIAFMEFFHTFRPICFAQSISSLRTYMLSCIARLFIRNEKGERESLIFSSRGASWKSYSFFFNSAKQTLHNHHNEAQSRYV